MKAGVDVGYGYTKAISPLEKVIFPSVVGTVENIRYQSELARRREGRISELDGHSYFVGELAQTQSRLQFTLLDRSWIKSRQYRILFLTALGELRTAGGSEEAQFKVVTGLPVEYYQDKEVVAGPILGTHQIKINGRQRELKVVRLKVIPQPVGSLFHLILNSEGRIQGGEMARSRVGIIDIGYYTTDFVLVDELEFIDKASGSINVGMGTVYQTLARKISEQFGFRNLSLPRVERYLREEALRIHGKRREIRPLAEPVLAETAESILSQARTIWGEGQDLDRVLITGGGAEVLKDYLSGYPQAVIAEGPVTANAEGFLKYARRTFK